MLVTQFSDELLADGVRLAAQLRRAGLNTELYHAPDKLKKQMSYAAGRAIPAVVVLGPDEAREGRATLKNMLTGDQVVLAQHELLPEAIRTMLP